MDIDRLKIRKRVLLMEDNPEWQKLLYLQALVQSDFHKQKHLSINTFQQILNWKFPEQEHKVDKIIEACPASLLKTISKCYHEIQYPDTEMEMRIKLHTLLSIPWIGFGISTSIMAFHFPDKFASIDQVIWFHLYRKNKSTFSIKEYIKYLDDLSSLTKALDCNYQETAFLIKNGRNE